MFPLELINKLYKQILEEQKPKITPDQFDGIFTELQIWDSQYPNYADADLPAKIKTIALYASDIYKDEKANRLLATAAMINSDDFELWLNLSKQKISDSGKCDLWPIFRGAFYLRMACLTQGNEKKSSNELSRILTEKMVSLQWKKIFGGNLGLNTIEVAQHYELNKDPIYFLTAFYLCYLSTENEVAADEVQGDYLPLNLGILCRSNLNLQINLTRKNNYFIDVIKNKIKTAEKNSEVNNYINTYLQQLQTINKQYMTLVKDVAGNNVDGKISDGDLYQIFSGTTLPLIWEYIKLYGKEKSLSQAYQNLIAIQQILAINEIKNPLLSGMIDYQIAVCCMEGIGIIRNIPLAVEKFTASHKVAIKFKDPSTEYLCLNALKKIAENCEIPAQKISAQIAVANCYKNITEDQDHPHKVRDLVLAQDLYQEIQKHENTQWVNGEQRETLQKCQAEVTKKIEILKAAAINEQAQLFFYRGSSAAKNNELQKAKEYLQQSFNLGLRNAGPEYARICIDKETPSNFDEAFSYLNKTVDNSITIDGIYAGGLVAFEMATKHANSRYISQVALMKEKIIHCALNNYKVDLERILNTIIKRTFQFKGDQSYNTITLTEEKFLHLFRLKALQLLPAERDENTNKRITDLIDQLVHSTNFVSDDINLVLSLMGSRDLFSVTSIDQFFKNVFNLLDKLPNLIAADDPNLLNIKTQIDNLISHLFTYISEKFGATESLPSITELASLFKLFAEKHDYLSTTLVSWLMNNRDPLEIIISSNITKPETVTVLDALGKIGSQQNIEFFKVFATYYKTMQQKQTDYAAKKQLYDETKNGNKTSFNKLETSTDELSKIFFYKYVRELDQDKSGKIANHYYMFGLSKPKPETIFPYLEKLPKKDPTAMWELAECYRTKYGKKNGNNENEALWWSFRAGFADVLNGEYYKLAKAEFIKSSTPHGRLFFYLLTGEKSRETTDSDFEDSVKNNLESIMSHLKKIKEIILDSQEIHEIRKLKLCERILALKVDKEDTMVANIQATYDKLFLLFTIPKTSNASNDNQYADFSSLVSLQNQLSVPTGISHDQKLTVPQNPVLHTPSAPSAPPLEETISASNQVTNTPQNQPAQEKLQLNNQDQTVPQSSSKNDSAEEAAKLANQNKELLERNNQLMEQNKILDTQNQTLKDELQNLKGQMQQLQQNFLMLEQQLAAQKTAPASPPTTLAMSREATQQLGGYIQRIVKQAVSETVPNELEKHLPKEIKINLSPNPPQSQAALLESQGTFKKKKSLIKKVEVSTKDPTQGTVRSIKLRSPLSVKSLARKNR